MGWAVELGEALGEDVEVGKLVDVAEAEGEADAEAVAVGVADGLGMLGFRACADKYRHPGGACTTG